MNLSGLSELLLAWFKSQGTTAMGQGEPLPVNPLLAPGKVYEARVLDNLPSGRHLVQVAGQKMDMPLPRGTQPGEAVRLTYLGGGPRPTFLLNQTAQAPVAAASQPVNLSQAAQQAGALSRLAGPAQSPGGARGLTPIPANLAPADLDEKNGSASAGAGRPTAAPSTPVATLSKAAVAVAAEAAAAPRSVPAPMARATAAAVAGPAQPPAGNAASEGTRSIASGERLARPASAPPALITGSRAVAANLVMLSSAASTSSQVPGGVVSPNTALVGQVVDGARAAVPSSTTLTPNVLADLPEPSRSLLPARLSQTLSESGLFYESHLARWTRGELSFDALLREPQARFGREESAVGQAVPELGGMPDEVARIAGRQLQILDGAPLLWQGFAWPGQWMEWQVEERYPEGGEGGGEEAGERWATELHLHLPRLGSVHAHIGLRGDRLDVRLTARDPAVREAMQAALPALVNGLEAAGLTLANLTVGLVDET